MPHWWEDSELDFQDEEENEVSEEEKQREQYQNQTLREVDRDLGSPLQRVILDAGGIDIGVGKGEEYQSVPLAYRRKGGLPPDEMADHFARSYPSYQINDENDLMNRIADMFYAYSWWKKSNRAQINTDGISPGEFYKFLIIDDYFELWDGEDYHHDEAIFEYFGVSPVDEDGDEENIEEVAGNSHIIIGDVNNPDLGASEGFLVDAQSLDSRGFNQQDEQLVIQYLPEADFGNSEVEASVYKRSSWRKSADPYLDDEGYMTFEQGEENWFNNDFRVGDTVMLLDTGEEAEILENYGDDTYLVRTESGEDVDVTMSNLQKVDAEPMEDPQYQDLERFQGGDPEAQDWEDSSYDNQYLDESQDNLQQGDFVRVYAPEEGHISYGEMRGYVTNDSDPYEVDIGQESVSFGRREIELLERGSDQRLSTLKSAAGTASMGMNYLKEKNIDVQKMSQNILKWYEMAEADDSAEGTGWYDNAKKFGEGLADTYGFTTEQAVSTIAILSSQTGWEDNKKYAEACLKGYSSGERDPWNFRVHPNPGGKIFATGQDRRKIIKVLEDSEDPEQYVGGDKIRPFYKNMMGDHNTITNDVWAMRIAVDEVRPKNSEGVSFGSPGAPVKRMMTEAYQLAAEQVGITPREMQAITWNVMRNRYGQAAESLEYRKQRDESQLASFSSSWWKGAGGFNGLWQEFDDEADEAEFWERWKNEGRDAHALGIELYNRGYSEEDLEEFLGNQLGGGFGMRQFDAAYNGYMEVWKASDPMNQDNLSDSSDPLEELYRNSKKKSWWKKSIDEDEFNSMWNWSFVYGDHTGEKVRTLIDKGSPVKKAAIIPAGSVGLIKDSLNQSNFKMTPGQPGGEVYQSESDPSSQWSYTIMFAQEEKGGRYAGNELEFADDGEEITDLLFPVPSGSFSGPNAPDKVIFDRENYKPFGENKKIPRIGSLEGNWWKSSPSGGWWKGADYFEDEDERREDSL